MYDLEAIKGEILNIFENKVKKLSLKNDATFEFSKRHDLEVRNPIMAMSAGDKEISAALENLTYKTNGRFKIVDPRDIKKITKDDWAQKPTSIFDKADVIWTIRFSSIEYDKDKVFRTSEKQQKRIFWLTPADLSTEISGEKRLIKFAAEGVKYKILEVLSSDYTKKEDIASEIETTPRNVEVQISELRRKAKSKFDLKKDEFIEGLQRKGYRLGENIRIMKK